MGGSKGENGPERHNQPAQHASYTNGAGVGKRELMQAYETNILEKEEGEERDKGRYIMEGMAVDFLLTVEHAGKFCRAVADVLDRSATGIRSWNPPAAARAFGHIERYALNLWDHPWKKAYKIIKVDPHIRGADELFRIMGYEGTPNTLVMRVKSSREQLLQVAVEAFLLSVECNLYYMVLQRVEHIGYDVLDVHQCRQEFVADIDASIEWISRNLKPYRRMSGKAGGGGVGSDSPGPGAGGSGATVTSPDQRSKSGASVLETVSGIESVLCRKVQGEAPAAAPSLLRVQQVGLARPKKGRVSADSGYCSKPGSKEIPPIEEHDEEEFPPPPSPLGSPHKTTTTTAPRQQEQGSHERAGAGQQKREPHAPLATAEEHQLISAQLLSTLDRKKTTTTVDAKQPEPEPTPVPPPRPSRSKEWEHVTENLKTRYGQEYYNGPRGDVLQLNGAAQNAQGKAGKAPPPARQESGSQRSSPGREVCSPGSDLHVMVHTTSPGVRSPLSPPSYSQMVTGAGMPRSTHHARPLTVNIPPVKRSVSPYENNSPSPNLTPDGGQSGTDCEYRTESFESKIKRPPSAEDLLEVLKPDEQYSTALQQRNDFSTFGKRPPRPARTKKGSSSSARKSQYDNYPSLVGPELTRELGLVGRGLPVGEPNLYQSKSLAETTGANTKRVSPVTADNQDKYYSSYNSNSDYGFNVVTSAANRRRHAEQSDGLARQISPASPGSPAKSAVAPPQQLWQCAVCTFANQAGQAVCEMCGRSKRAAVEAGSPLRSGGPQCPHCTLVNEAGTKVCKACDSDLEGCATYI